MRLEYQRKLGDRSLTEANHWQLRWEEIGWERSKVRIQEVNTGLFRREFFAEWWLWAIAKGIDSELNKACKFRDYEGANGD